MVFVLSLLATVCDLSVLAAFTIQEKSLSESRVRPGILAAYQRDAPNVPQTRPHAARNPKKPHKTVCTRRRREEGPCAQS